MYFWQNAFSEQPVLSMFLCKNIQASSDDDM
jgi:hypothetical protein